MDGLRNISRKSEPMISVTRLNGTAFALNPSLIERMECTPDTVLSLVTGTKYVVAESMAEVIERIIAFQASITVTSDRMRRQLADGADFALHIVHDEREE
jgi:flagellar protein FlbD